MRRWKKTVALLCVVILGIAAFVPALSASAQQYNGYIYNSWGESVEAPNTYECSSVLMPQDLGGVLQKPSDMFFSTVTRQMYILDKAAGSVVITDDKLTVKQIIREFHSDAGAQTLNNPSGIFVDSDGIMYISDTDNNRVLIVSPVLSEKEGGVNITGMLTYEKSEINTQDIVFRPVKVVKDKSGNTYVLSLGFYQGAIIFNKENNFVGFYGSNDVEATLAVLANMFWKKIMSNEQVDSLANFVPTEYTSFDIADDGFIYSCTNTTKTNLNQVKKLNTMGNNILTGRNRGSVIDTAKFGDIEIYYNGYIKTNFVDIKVDNDGFIYLLDQSLNKVYWYNIEGELIGTLGARGDRKGTFTTATAVEVIDDRVVVLDGETGAVSLFERTEYGRDVAAALRLYNDGRYAEAEPYWRRVVVACPNFELAYVSIGKTHYINREYAEAMKYFKLGYDRTGYSDAFKEYRTAYIRSNAWFLVGTVAVIIALLVIAVKLFKKRGRWLDKQTDKRKLRLAKIGFPFASMRHIRKNFEELKTDKRASVPVAVGILALFFIAMICSSRYSAFIFNKSRPSDFNVLILFASTVLIFILWCMCNWGISTLLDGKGKFKYIFLISAYSLLPSVFALFLNLGLSGLFTADEGMFLTWFTVFGLCWSAAMLIKGMSEIHEYSGGKIVLSFGLTIAGMAAVIFLGVLMFSLVSQFAVFVQTIFTEVSFRYM